MPSLLKIFLTCVLLIALVIICIYPNKIVLVTPRLSIPAVVLPGEKISITLKHSLPLVNRPWQVQLQLAGQPAIALEVLEKQVRFGYTTLSTQVPEDIAVGSYALHIDASKSKTSEAKAVNIVKEYSNKFSIIQLADLPTLVEEGDGEKRLKTIIDEINIINPDAVLFTGDVAYGGSWPQYDRLMELLELVDAPVIAAPGNHEYYGWAGYITRLGQPYHHVKIGQYEFISLNSGHGRDQITQSQLQWLKDILVNSQAKQIILQLHHPIHHRADLSHHMRGNIKLLLDLIKKYKVAIVLSGHWHGDAVYDETGTDRTDTWKFDGTPFVVTTTAGADFRPPYSSSPLHYGYRLIRFVNDELENYTYDYDGDGVRDAASSIPMGMITVTKNGQFGVSIENGLNEGFNNAKVTIEVPDSDNRYYPSVGTIYSQEKHSQVSIYKILLDLPANQTTAVTMVLKEQRND